MRKRPGFTLIELIVVIGILSILGTTTSYYFLRVAKDDQNLQNRAVVVGDLSTAVDRVTRVLRSSTQIVSTTSTSIRIRGYPETTDTVPSEIYFYISNNKLLYDVIPPTGTPPNYTYNPANAKTFTLLSRVTNSPTLPLFQYYDDTNTLLSGSYSLADIHAIGFAPSALDAKATLSAPITTQTVITLRNFKTNL